MKVTLNTQNNYNQHFGAINITSSAKAIIDSRKLTQAQYRLLGIHINGINKINDISVILDSKGDRLCASLSGKSNTVNNIKESPLSKRVNRFLLKYIRSIRRLAQDIHEFETTVRNFN